jgi:hypothetical protein
MISVWLRSSGVTNAKGLIPTALFSGAFYSVQPVMMYTYTAAHTRTAPDARHVFSFTHPSD